MKIEKAMGVEQTGEFGWIRKKKKRKGERKKERTSIREREKGKRGFRFSLRSTEIGLSVFVRARGKVGPRNKGYAWVPKSRSFVKP